MKESKKLLGLLVQKYQIETIQKESLPFHHSTKLQMMIQDLQCFKYKNGHKEAHRQIKRMKGIHEFHPCFLKSAIITKMIIREIQIFQMIL